MNHPRAERGKTMIGTRILVGDNLPVVVEVKFGKELLNLEPQVLARLSEQFVKSANIALFVERYRMMLVMRGEPNPSMHARELLTYMGGIISDSQTESENPKVQPGDNIPEIPSQ